MWPDGDGRGGLFTGIQRPSAGHGGFTRVVVVDDQDRSAWSVPLWRPLDSR
jgi:hypothetical protein